MKRPLLIATGSLCTLLAVAYFSARTGYDFARRELAYPIAGSRAFEIESVLESLHAGNVEAAESLLEVQLDTEFMNRWVYDRHSNRILSVLRTPEEPAAAALFGTAAKYRTTHPSAHPNPTVRAKIAAVVAKYEPLAIKPQTSPN